MIKEKQKLKRKNQKEKSLFVRHWISKVETKMAFLSLEENDALVQHLSCPDAVFDSLNPNSIVSLSHRPFEMTKDPIYNPIYDAMNDIKGWESNSLQKACLNDNAQKIHLIAMKPNKHVQLIPRVARPKVNFTEAQRARCAVKSLLAV